jgi:hypothetical protein
VTETFVSGLPSAGAASVAFDTRGAFGGDMYVSWPDQSWVEADPIYRITPAGQGSLFF